MSPTVTTSSEANGNVSAATARAAASVAAAEEATGPQAITMAKALNTALADALLAAKPVQIAPVQLAFSYDEFVQFGGVDLARKVAKGDYIQSNGKWFGAIALAELEKDARSLRQVSRKYEREIDAWIQEFQ